MFLENAQVPAHKTSADTGTPVPASSFKFFDGNVNEVIVSQQFFFMVKKLKAKKKGTEVDEKLLGELLPTFSVSEKGLVI